MNKEYLTKKSLYFKTSKEPLGKDISKTTKM